jgi:Xaa-Pro aminopeptidase
MPDAFVAFGVGVRKVAVVSTLEFSRVRRTLDFDVAPPLETYLQSARAASADHVLRRGAVAPVETDLHYPGLGGCRIEDVAQVTEGSPKLLSRYHSNREIS